MTFARLYLRILLTLMLVLPAAGQAGEITIEEVRFAKGSSSATLQGHIKGYQTIDYTLRARAGQTMQVSLATRHGANYFNVLPPGTEEALFVGSTSGNEWTGPLPIDGEYRIRVYLMRSAARRNEQADYSLTVAVTGKPSAPVAQSAKDPRPWDAKVPGTEFHATGQLPCAMGVGPLAPCDFGVIRGQAGQAEVHVTPPGTLKRVLHFTGEKVEVGEGESVKASFQDGVWSVEVNDFEHYQVVEAIINGG